MSLVYCNIFIIISSHTLTFHNYREHNAGQKRNNRPTLSTRILFTLLKKCVCVYAGNTSLEKEDKNALLTEALKFTICQL